MFQFDDEILSEVTIPGSAMLFDLLAKDPLKPFEVISSSQMFQANPSMTQMLLNGRLTYNKRLSPVNNDVNYISNVELP